MDRIQELLTRLADLSDAEIAELEGLILSEFDSVEAEEPTTDSVERMVGLADALDSVRGEVGRRNERAQELAQQASEASARVHANRDDAPAEAEMASKVDDEEDVAEGELPTVDEISEDIEQVTEDVVEAVEDAEAAGDETTEEEDDEEKKLFSEDSPAEAELSDSSTEHEVVAETAVSTETTELSSGSEDQPETPTETSEQENAMTASIDQGDGVVVTPPADAAPVPSLTASGVALTITAGADIPSYGTGAELSNMDQVADAFAKRLHTLRNVQGGSGAQYTIATLAFEYPEDRKVGGEDPANMTKIAKVNSVEAITAAAGICAPLEPIYDINVCGDNDRPIRDALARFNADRGGVKIYGSPTFDPKSVGIWDTSGAATKSCGDASCPTPKDIMLDAVYACLKFNNFTNRFFPEIIKANTDLALINHARVAEMNLLAQIATSSTAVTAKAVPNLGVTRALIRTVLDASALLRRKHRLAVNSPLRVILPSWVLDAIDADLAQQMPGDGLDTLMVSESFINGLFRSRGINVTWSLDSWDNGANSTLPTGTEGFDAKVSFPMFPEGAFLFLDGGTLDLGVQRDATMLAANEYATFVETFEGVAFTGCESLWITMDVCVSGAAAALVQGVC